MRTEPVNRTPGPDDTVQVNRRPGRLGVKHWLDEVIAYSELLANLGGPRPEDQVPGVVLWDFSGPC